MCVFAFCSLLQIPTSTAGVRTTQEAPAWWASLPTWTRCSVHAAGRWVCRAVTWTPQSRPPRPHFTVLFPFDAPSPQHCRHLINLQASINMQLFFFFSFQSPPLHITLCLPNSLLQFPVSTSVWSLAWPFWRGALSPLVLLRSGVCFPHLLVRPGKPLFYPCVLWR